MRQSELEARIQQLAGTLFKGAREVLTLGAGSAVGEPSASWAHPQRFDAALWRLSSDTSQVRAGLTILRGALTAGASVLLAAPRRAPAFHQLKAALSGEQAPRARLEPLCGALLLVGFLEPRVHDAVPGHLLVSAHLPSMLDPLDAFFAQPAETAGR
ncbi:MAG: hypothetical protein JWN48_79 [Myxococcaceae bacterium]|nr:hypothetical protein [Myxococcaceae bacterium]